MKNCPDGSHCQNEYLIEDLEQEVAIRTVEYDEAKELADDLYLLLVDDPRTKAMADEVIRLHQARKTTPYTYTLRQRIDELTAENTRMKSELVTKDKKLTDYEKELRKLHNYDKTCSTCRYLDENQDCVLGIRCVNYALWQGRIL